MASYIDLNPVRAGIVKDPADYRWSGYGEAVAGKKAAREGLRLVMHEQLCCAIGEKKAGEKLASKLLGSPASSFRKASDLRRRLWSEEWVT